MAKIRDADSKGKDVSKKSENLDFDEKANMSRKDNQSEAPRILDLFGYLRKQRENSANRRGERTTDLSSEIAGDLSSRNNSGTFPAKWACSAAMASTESGNSCIISRHKLATLNTPWWHR